MADTDIDSSPRLLRMALGHCGFQILKESCWQWSWDRGENEVICLPESEAKGPPYIYEGVNICSMGRITARIK